MRNQHVSEVIFLYLVFFVDVGELKAPGMSPNLAEHLKVLEQVRSSLPLCAISHRTQTWEKKNPFYFRWSNLTKMYHLDNYRKCVQEPTFFFYEYTTNI